MNQVTLTMREIRSITEGIAELRRDNERLKAALKHNGFKECRLCGELDAREFFQVHPALREPARFSLGSKHWCSNCLAWDEMAFDRHEDELWNMLKSATAFEIAQALRPFAEILLAYWNFYNFQGNRDRSTKVAQAILDEEESRASRGLQRFRPCESPISLWEMFMDILREIDRYQEVVQMIGRFGGTFHRIPYIQEHIPVWNHRAFYVLSREENLMLANSIRHLEADRDKQSA